VKNVFFKTLLKTCHIYQCTSTRLFDGVLPQNPLW